MNIRTINGAKHNSHLGCRYSCIQDRAATVLDTWNEYRKIVRIPIPTKNNWEKLHRVAVSETAFSSSTSS